MKLPTGKWKERLAGGMAAAGAMGAAALAISATRRAGYVRQPRLRTYRYNRRYIERIRLKEGSEVWLRLVMPWDKRQLSQGMARLSPDSRYERFHVGKNRLTAEELRYLTEVDGVDHLAIGAMEARVIGNGLGVARFVRLPRDPESAEAAIVVADSARRKGLARILLSRLMDAARERGIRTLVWEVLATNRAMLNLLESAAPESKRGNEGSTVIVRMPV